MNLEEGQWEFHKPTLERSNKLAKPNIAGIVRASRVPHVDIGKTHSALVRQFDRHHCFAKVVAYFDAEMAIKLAAKIGSPSSLPLEDGAAAAEIRNLGLDDILECF
jgi:hypothetical protein